MAVAPGQGGAGQEPGLELLTEAACGRGSCLYGRMCRPAGASRSRDLYMRNTSLVPLCRQDIHRAMPDAERTTGAIIAGGFGLEHSLDRDLTPDHFIARGDHL